MFLFILSPLIASIFFFLFYFVYRKSIESTKLGRATSAQWKTIKSVPKTAFPKEAIGAKNGGGDDDDMGNDNYKIIDEDDEITVRNKRIESTTTPSQTLSRQTSSFFTSKFMFSTH